MLTTQMVRTNGVAASLPGGYGAREFAAREFPREDYHWVAHQLSRPTAAPAAGRGLWARIREWFVTPGKIEAQTEANLEPTTG
jgi:hypothetical protein